MSGRSRRWFVKLVQSGWFPRSLVAALLLAVALVAAFSLPALGSSFVDVPGDYPHAPAIEELANRHIFEGYGDGRFGPEDLVLRQQFAKVIVLTLGLPVSEADICSFLDVWISGPESLYPDNYIAKAASTHITEGKTPWSFAPYDHITRAQVISMVVRAAQNLHPGLLVTPPPDYQSTWDPAFSPDHGWNARTAEFNSLLAGLPLAELDPWAPMPRGEVAQVLYNFLMKFMPSPTTSTTQPGTTTTQSTTTTTQPTTTTQSTTTTTQSTTTTTLGTTEAWIHYKISTVKMNQAPRIHGNHVAWVGDTGGLAPDQVFLHDIAAGVTSQITSGQVYDCEYLDIQGNWVAMERKDSTQSDIFLYDIAAQKLTRLTFTATSEKHPSISSGRVVWSGYDGQDWELFLYDIASGQTTQLTGDTLDQKEPQFDGSWVTSVGCRHPSVTYETLSLHKVDGSHSRLLLTDADDRNARVRGNFVVWERHDVGGGVDIYLHDIALSKTTNLTPPLGIGEDRHPTMDNGRIVWERSDGWDYELILYDIAAGTTTQLTNNSFSDYSPNLTGVHLVWSADTTPPGTDVYYRDLGQPGLGSPEQVVADSVGRNLYPQVHMKRVVWVRVDGNSIDQDILLGEKAEIPIIPLGGSGLSQ